MSTLQYINDYMKEDIITIPCYLEKGYKYTYDQNIQVKDQSESLIRLSLPRKPYIPIQKSTLRKRGYIVMENQLAGRYSGEVSLMKQDLSFISRTNTIAIYSSEYIDVLDFINANTNIDL